MRYFKTPISRKLYGQIYAFIVPKPCGFTTPRTRMPAGIPRIDIHVWQQPYVCATSTGATVDVGHALQRRDSGRHHLRLISVSLSDRSHGLLKSPQSLDVHVISYEKAISSRLRTRMTRIARIFTDPCVSASSAYLLKNKPQINADERRLIAPGSHLINNIQFFGENYS